MFEKPPGKARSKTSAASWRKRRRKRRHGGTSFLEEEEEEEIRRNKPCHLIRSHLWQTSNDWGWRLQTKSRKARRVKETKSVKKSLLTEEQERKKKKRSYTFPNN